MEITLIRTGGIIPIIKTAKEDVDLTEKEIEQLIKASKADDKPGKARDNHHFQLEYNNQTYTIDIEKIPAEYKELIEKLKKDLQIVKPQ